MTVRTDTDGRDAGDGRGDMLDLSALWLAIKHRKAWIIGPTLAALGLSFVAVNLVTERFTGEARILLENRDSFYTRPGQSGGDSAGQQFDSEAVQSQVQLIMSRDLAREAIKRIGLVGNSEFDSGAGALNAIKKLGVVLGLGAHPADRSPEERVLEKYYDRLLVYPVGRSRIVAVEFTSQSPAIAAAGANAIAAAYIERQEAAKQDTARSASSWLSTTIEPLRRRLGEAEAKVEAFRSRNGLLVGANNTTITSQQLADLSTQLSSARTQQAEAQAKAGIIRDAIKTGRTFEIPDVANNELVRRLIEQRVNLRTQIALESRNLLSEHPRIKELNAQLADLEGQLRAASERTVRMLENEARIAGQRVESFTAALDSQKKNVSTANDSEVQLRALEREARTLREQLEQYMLRYREAVARDTQNATPADARIVSTAVEPTAPSFPKKLPTVIVATLAAFFISLATVVSRELLNGVRALPARRREPEPMLFEEPTPQAALVPSRAAEPAFAFMSEPEPVRVAPAIAEPPAPAEPVLAAAEAPAWTAPYIDRTRQVVLDFDMPDQTLADLAEQIEEPPRGLAPIVVVLDVGEDGAWTADDLAGLLAKRCRCVMVDLSRNGPPGEAGVSELIAGEASFADIITRDAATPLHRIGAGRAGRRAVLAVPDVIEMTLDALSETYEWVFVLTHPSDDDATLGSLVTRCQGAVIMAGRPDNSAAFTLADRVGYLTYAPVIVTLDGVAEPSEMVEREGASV